MSLSPAAILHNTAGTEVGTAADPVRVDPTGETTQPVSDGGGSLTVDGPITDAQLRATPVPVSGPLTDTELRASAVVVSQASQPLPTGAATEATLASLKDTDGIKKITDALPTGTNELGKIKITDNSGNVIGTLSRTLYSDPNGDRRTIHNNATLTANGSQILTWVGYAEWYLIVNLKDAPTGTAPTIQFKIEQVDPLDTTSVLTDARSYTGVVKTAAGQDIIEVPEFESDTVKISWTITGTTPSWTGVNVTFCGHASGNAIEGQAAVGTVAEDPPVGVAGVDDADTIRYLRVDASGNLQVVVNSTPSGSVAGFARGDVTTAVIALAAVRRTTYTEQIADAQRSIVSANADDTAAGTGARTVKIVYLDSTGAGPYTETVTLNGTTAVNTVASNICFIEKLEVMSVGSGGSNAGIISLKAATAGGGATIWTVGASDNETFGCHHYVPVGKTAHITAQWAGHTGTTVGSGATFTVRSFPLNVANAVEKVISDSFRLYGQSSSVQRNYGSAILVSGPARLLTYVLPETSTSVNYRASFDLYED